MERWDLSDNPAKQAHKKQFDDLLEELGFLENKPLTDDVTVNHCVIFGATPMRVETRIEETLSYLNTHLRVTDHIFLLGSNRKLTELEIQFLQSKIEKISDERKAYWQEVFATPEHSIEANSCSFLWEYLTALTPPSKPVNVISIKSTRIGFSYYDTQGHRSTTETTAEDWLKFYRKKEAQTIFAVIEQPFRRLCDQLQETTLTHAKKASLEDLTSRLANTTFHFVTTTPKTPPLISVYLDEVARHVYRIKGIIEYCNSLS